MLPGWCHGMLLRPSDLVEPGSLTDYFANNGATWPNYGGLMLPALYDSTSNRTYVAWEAFVNSARSQVVTYYDHATGRSGDIMGMGVSLLVDDDHGNPSIALDDEGHLHGFYGSHGALTGSASRHSSTRWPIADAAEEGSLWAIRSNISSANTHTYPKPHAIGTKLYVFFRGTVSGSNSRYLELLETNTLVAGEATWLTEKQLIDFGADTRVYAGNSVIRGTKIHFTATLGDLNDTIRLHVYYFIYDTSDGSLKNWDESVSTASGSLPVSLATSNTSYRIFTHGGSNGGGVPALAFDSNDVPHVLYTDGSGSSYDLEHMYTSGGSWTSPTTLDTLDNRFDAFCLCPLAGGKIEAFYPRDDGSLWTRGGNMYRKEMSAAGSWGAARMILEADTAALDSPNQVRNAHTNARVTFCEIANSSADADAGDLRVYLWGANGLILRVAESDAEVVSTADGVVLLSGDAQAGTDELLTSGDAQSGTDALQISIGA